jgi:hypothetical protein
MDYGSRELSECNRNIVLTHLVTGNLAWSRQDNSVLLLNVFNMSRLKQSHNIDSLIETIEAIAKNRCSFSEEDVKILNEASVLLQNLKRKKGKTNKETLEIVVKVIELLSQFFKR